MTSTDILRNVVEALQAAMRQNEHNMMMMTGYLVFALLLAWFSGATVVLALWARAQMVRAWRKLGYTAAACALFSAHAAYMYWRQT